MMESQPIFFHLMLKQGFNWFMLASEDVEIENVKKKNFIFGSTRTSLPTDTIDKDLTIWTVKGI